MDASGIDRFIGLAKKLGIQPARDVARGGDATAFQSTERQARTTRLQQGEGVRVSLSSAAIGASSGPSAEASSSLSSARPAAPPLEGARLEAARNSVLRTGRHALAASAYARSSAASPGQHFQTKA